MSSIHKQNSKAQTRKSAANLHGDIRSQLDATSQFSQDTTVDSIHKANMEAELRQGWETISGFDKVSAATRLLDKRKEMLEVQTTLEDKRSDFKNRLVNIKESENDLIRKRNELTDNLIKLDKFIRENEIRRTRAEKKAEEEQKAKEDRQQEIEAKRKEQQRLEKKKEKIQKRLEKYLKFQRFLQQVAIARGDDNPEHVEPVLTRYQTLLDKFDELTQQNSLMEKDVEMWKAKIQKYHDEKEAEIVQRNYDITNLQRDLAYYKNRAGKAQHDHEVNIEKKAEMIVTLGEIRMACNNIYTRTTEKSLITRENESKQTDILAQLKVIRECVGDFSYIVNEHRRPGTSTGSLASNPFSNAGFAYHDSTSVSRNHFV